MTPHPRGVFFAALTPLDAELVPAPRFGQLASLKGMLGAKLNDAAWFRLRPPLPLPPEETAALLAA